MSWHSDGQCRCAWLGKWAGANDPLYRDYHDLEWGVPLRDETALFELLTLEGAQAGLAWITILKKRENYRRAFEQFNIERVAAYTDTDMKRLMADSGIVRNRLKIGATITNAQAWLSFRATHGSVADFLWSFTGGITLQNRRKDMSDIPARTPQSDAMSKALKQNGFRFVGSTICYAFMQAAGMVNDHTIDCFRHPKIPFTSMDS